jgi:IS30 family transposase
MVADALAAKITTLPAALTRTLTWDQGNEMAAHTRFTDQTGIEVYFCDPKSPWRRGTMAHRNTSLIRGGCDGAWVSEVVTCG